METGTWGKMISEKLRTTYRDRLNGTCACKQGEEAVVGSVDDTVTDRTLVDTFKFFVKVVLPNSDSFC